MRFIACATVLLLASVALGAENGHPSVGIERMCEAGLAMPWQYALRSEPLGQYAKDSHFFLSASTGPKLVSEETRKALADAGLVVDFVLAQDRNDATHRHMQFHVGEISIFQKKPFHAVLRLDLPEPVSSLEFFPAASGGILAVVGWTQVQYFNLKDGEFSAVPVAEVPLRGVKTIRLSEERSADEYVIRDGFGGTNYFSSKQLKIVLSKFGVGSIEEFNRAGFTTNLPRNMKNLLDLVVELRDLKQRDRARPIPLSEIFDHAARAVAEFETMPKFEEYFSPIVEIAFKGAFNSSYSKSFLANFGQQVAVFSEGRLSPIPLLGKEPPFDDYRAVLRFSSSRGDYLLYYGKSRKWPLRLVRV